MLKKVSLFVIIILLVKGCGLFDVRDSEPPVNPRDTNQFATSSEMLIKNFITSVREMNADNYTANFADSVQSGFKYIFTPSSNAALIYPVFSGEWGREEENRYFRNFLAELSEERKVTITLTDSVINRYGDSALFICKYSLAVPPSSNQQLLTYSGEMRLRMKVNKNLIWEIFHWEDYKTTINPSWSDLKGEKY
ncbi:MAG: hypothetical protein HRU80_11565 [Ignavibacteriales bacterium]|nr:MAG: hypothetical protein HRU80_11565 [Ignavibacteriales bacterium]